MQRIALVLLLTITGFSSCKQANQEKAQGLSTPSAFSGILGQDYELYKPSAEIEALLILFGGYPEEIEDLKRAFEILDLARENGVAVMLYGLNQKLWLEENEKYQLAESLQSIIIDNQLPSDNIFIGGFSSGGNVSLLISNFIVGMKRFFIDPKGVFIIDSPIDLLALYRASEKNIERQFSAPAVQESTFLIEHLESKIGNPQVSIKKYEDKAVFTYQTQYISNLTKLRNTKIRLYTEPDTLWWKTNRMAEYDQMNAFYIKALAEALKKEGFKDVEYIPTTNKGFRSNGDRHPHSWSIVDKADLIRWMLKG